MMDVLLCNVLLSENVREMNPEFIQSFSGTKAAVEWQTICRRTVADVALHDRVVRQASVRQPYLIDGRPYGRSGKEGVTNSIT